MGDGYTLPITHSGTICLTTPNHTFHLKNTLSAPAIKQNLLSVSKFCSDNSTSIEFSPNNFCVKDLHSVVPLVHGKNKDGLYQWPQSSMHSSPGPQSYVASKKHSLFLWHRLLGPPHQQLLKSILHSSALLVS